MGDLIEFKKKIDDGKPVNDGGLQAMPPAIEYIEWLEEQVKNLRIADESTGRLVKAGQTILGNRFEERLHAIGKELEQEFASTDAFVRRVFEGMPPHVAPGSVAAYDVAQPEQPVVRIEKLAPSTKAGWPPDVMK
jgi:hypothetical protein